MRAALGPDVSTWISRLRTLWRDRVRADRPAELIVVRHRTRSPPGGGHLILVQQIPRDLRAVLLSVHLRSQELRLHDQVAELIHRRVHRSDVASLASLDHFRHANYQVLLGLRAMEATEVWPVEHRNHIEVFLHFDQPQEGQVPDPDLAGLMQTCQRTESRQTKTCAIDLPTVQDDSENFQFDMNAPAFDPGIPDLRTMPDVIQDLHFQCSSVVQTWEDEIAVAIVVTWFVDRDARGRRVCRVPRQVRPDTNFQHWESIIKHAWQDEILPGAEISFNLVTPNLPMRRQGIAAHVILVQRPHDELCTSLISVFDFRQSTEEPTCQVALTTTEHNGTHLS